VIKKIVDEIRKGHIKTRRDLDRLKKKFGMESLPQNSEILARLTEKEKEKYRNILLKKPSRNISGVTVIAVMSKPRKCPHGKCLMCPEVEGVPESYTGKEPAARRGLMFNFDPYKQVHNRLKQYYSVGHTPSKIELIIMGGTFLSFPEEYQEWFITKCYQALNDYPGASEKDTSLEETQRINETSKHRCVAVVFETRPDWCDTREINNMLRFGGTRVELGVQSLDDNILKNINRGHSVQHTINATRRLREAGLKVDYHVMLGLPGSSFESDKKMFNELFTNPNFRPDGLKIYPTLVIEGTELFDMWKRGAYKPIDDDYVIKLLSEVKTFIPEYVRIKRIMRDIPLTEISAGPKSSNLREKVWSVMNAKCNCIRCREAGRKKVVGEIRLVKREYEASGGKEIFLSFESDNALIGFLRLRIGKKCFVRELHVYGSQVPIGKVGESWQHKGYGKRLLNEAEKLANHKLYITSGIGVRQYYKKLGYEKEGFYMVKKL